MKSKGVSQSSVSTWVHENNSLDNTKMFTNKKIILINKETIPTMQVLLLPPLISSLLLILFLLIITILTKITVELETLIEIIKWSTANSD